MLVILGHLCSAILVAPESEIPHLFHKIYKDDCFHSEKLRNISYIQESIYDIYVDQG